MAPVHAHPWTSGRRRPQAAAVIVTFSNSRGPHLLATAVVALVVTCAMSGSAGAAPFFARSQVIATGGCGPVVSMGPSGDVIVAWMGRQRGIFVARRGALGGAFSAPVQISDDDYLSNWTLALARNDRGDIALTWSGRPPGSDSNVGRLAVAPAGRGFGPPESVTAAWGNVKDAVVGDDGAVALAFVDGDGTDDSHAFLAIRPPGGPTAVTQEIGQGTFVSRVRLAKTPGGMLDAVWVARPRTSAPSARTGVYASDAQLGEALGPARLISDPGVHSGESPTTLKLVANRRGEMLAAWGSSAVLGAPFDQRVDVAVRPAGGEWGPWRTASAGETMVTGAGAALNDAGDAVVGWLGVENLTTTFRAAGQAFGAPVGGGFASYDTQGLPIALDAFGNSVVLSRLQSNGVGQIRAALRRRDAAPERDVAVSGIEPEVDAPAVATDPFGNGLVVWNNRGANWTVSAASYSAAPPVIAALRVGKSRLRFGTNEAAVVRVKARRRHSARSASQIIVARPGRNAPRLNRKMRLLLRRKGRYTMTVRTYDAGPSHATYKVKFRRR
jgi:hypothetical protein